MVLIYRRPYEDQFYFNIDLSGTKLLKNGGEKGIRTLDTVARIHAFQACAFNRSATSPRS